MEAEEVVEGVEEVALGQCQPWQLPGKPGELQLWHWNVPLPLALGVDGGGEGGDSQLQGGLVHEWWKKYKQSVAVDEAEVHQGRQQSVGLAGCPDWPSTVLPQWRWSGLPVHQLATLDRRCQRCG